MNKNKVLMALAIVVSVCMAVALISALRTVMNAVALDQEIPSGTVMLAVLTVVCTAVIWRDVLRSRKQNGGKRNDKK